jgi:hypothetical protein
MIKKLVVAIAVLLLVAGVLYESMYFEKWGLLAPPKDDPLYKGRRVSSYRKALTDADVEVRRQAARDFYEMPPEDGKTAHGDLLEAAAKDEDHMTQCLAALALSRIHPVLHVWIPMDKMLGPALLYHGLEDQDPAVRQVAAQALSEWGHVSDWAVPYLQKVATKDDDENVRKAAALALEKIGPVVPRPQPKAKGPPPMAKTAMEKFEAANAPAKDTSSAEKPKAEGKEPAKAKSSDEDDH